MAIRARRALVGLVTAVAALALPAVASATITPSLKLNQSAGTTAGSGPATGFNATFATTTGDSLKDLTLGLPGGLLANENIDGGACLTSSAPIAACRVGTGTVTVGAAPVPVTLYLVKAPKTTDVGGLAVVSGSTTLSTAEITFGATGANVVFTSLTRGITAISTTLTNLRLPSSCPSPPANVTLTADSQQSASPVRTTAPLTVTGCSGLPYAPALAVSETKDPADNGATLAFAITQAANEAASKTILLKLPSGLGVNLPADVTCLTGAGPGCLVGSATATSPLVPSAALAHGTVALGGSATTPTVTVSFPAPFAVTLVGDVSLSGGTVTIAGVPDVPLTSLNLSITGPNGQKAFTTSCKPSTTTGTFTSQSGVSKTVTSTVTLSGCAAKPTATGSVSGLAAGHPRLRIKASHGNGAANIASVAVGLPAGLKFAHSAFTTHRTCVTKSGTKKCTTTTLIKGLGVSGAGVKAVALRGGKLVITLTKAAASVTVNLSGPIVAESSSLQNRVKKHKANSLTVTLKVTDANHTSTSVPLKMRAH